MNGAKRFRVVDDPNGVAILLVDAKYGVVVFGTLLPKHPASGTFGGTGVTLFFILSGTLVSRPFLCATSEDAVVDWRDRPSHAPVLFPALELPNNLPPMNNRFVFFLAVFCSILASQATYYERPMLHLEDRLRPKPFAPEIAI